MSPLEERMMLSGMHTVADIFCCCCGQNVGWKYESAHEKEQKYKEGKFVLERGRIMDENINRGLHRYSKRDRRFLKCQL
uniref:Protein yippee-like n=1 Tax=Brassica oleracea var. oleracea TaxID=109376 RepID=A0A0D3AMB6_BRAOL